MKNLADFKRAIQVGTEVKTEYFNADGTINETQPRAKVVARLKTQFAIHRTMKDGSTYQSWNRFPKARDSKIEGNSITYLYRDTPLVKYTIIN